MYKNLILYLTFDATPIISNRFQCRCNLIGPAIVIDYFLGPIRLMREII